MKRLTWREDPNYARRMNCRDCLNSENCKKDIFDCRLYAVNHLATIEDILDDDYDLDHLRKLVQADREGRCVVLSEPMSPMVQILGDTDVYCPNCGNTLSGGWPLSEADDYRKMCQCPHCGQSIDDTKCEFSEEALKGEKHG